MEKLIIVGAGGFGKEVLQWAIDCNRENEKWEIKGFLDPNSIEKKEINGIPILPFDDDSYTIQEEDVFVCAIGDCNIREKVSKKLEQRGARFISIIHPTALISDTAEIGKGTVICPHAVISPDARIGEHCIVNIKSVVAHESRVGAFSILCCFCDVTGNCNIGKRVFMGSGSRVIPSKKIGDDVYIGAGSVVVSNLKKGGKVFGNPAHRIG